MKNRNAFSLIEILVVLALMGIVTVAASAVVLRVVRDSNRAAIKNELNHNAWRIMDQIGYEVRRAGCVMVDWDSSGTINRMILYPNTNCSGTIPAVLAVYWVGAQSRWGYQGYSPTGPSVLLPDKFSVSNCADVATSGLVVPLGQATKTQPLTVTLSLRPASPAYGPGADTCVTLTDTFVPRN